MKAQVKMRNYKTADENKQKNCQQLISAIKQQILIIKAGLKSSIFESFLKLAKESGLALPGKCFPQFHCL